MRLGQSKLIIWQCSSKQWKFYWQNSQLFIPLFLNTNFIPHKNNNPELLLVFQIVFYQIPWADFLWKYKLNHYINMQLMEHEGSLPRLWKFSSPSAINSDSKHLYPLGRFLMKVQVKPIYKYTAHGTWRFTAMFMKVLLTKCN